MLKFVSHFGNEIASGQMAQNLQSTFILQCTLHKEYLETAMDLHLVYKPDGVVSSMVND
jgi:hypothetical protein